MGAVKLWLFLGSSALSLSIVAEASARDFRVNDIPNGAAFQCMNCHQTNDGKTFTNFGTDARCHLFGSTDTSMEHVDWTDPSSGGLCGPLYLRDSDGDGFTNGEELGDPMGLWKPGMPNPPGAHSNPGDKNSTPPPVCGDGKLSAHEDCEGSMMSHTDCADLALGTGTLTCTPQCHFDTTACSLQLDSGGGAGGGSNGGGCELSSGASGSSATDGLALVSLVGAAALTAHRRARRASASRK